MDSEKRIDEVNLSELLAKIVVGDIVIVRNHSGNVMLPAGDYNMTVVATDDKSFAVKNIGPWWFYRDGQSYVGNASVVGVVG